MNLSLHMNSTYGKTDGFVSKGGDINKYPLVLLIAAILKEGYVVQGRYYQRGLVHRTYSPQQWVGPVKSKLRRCSSTVNKVYFAARGLTVMVMDLQIEMMIKMSFILLKTFRVWWI
ncbi:hypothetical protein KHA80_14620 [Anaerobacillus sp. HL2]|nr:hypothetical protein KHA80_14620 [Anaerobacillus sp. HL2]